MCEQRRTGLGGADLEEQLGAFPGFGFVGEEADGAIGLEAVDDPGAGGGGDAQAFVADRHAPIGADLEGCADTPDIGPPRAARGGAQHAAGFAPGGAGGGVGGALEFAMDFMGVAVTAQGRQERVGGGGRGDGFGGEEGGQAALPVLVLALDLALGLGRARVAQGDAVEVERGAELGQGVGALGKEEAVAVHIEFEGQAVFDEGGGQEVQVGQEVFGGIDGGAGADARAVIEQVQEGIMVFVAGEPAVGGGVELPERAGFEALPAAERGGRARGGDGMGELVGDGPAAHGGGIDLAAQAAVDFGGGAAIGRGGLGGEQFAQERLDAGGPGRRVIAAGSAGRPEGCRRAGGGAEIIGIEFVEAGAAQTELFGGAGGGNFVAAEGGEQFADQGGAEAMGELPVMFSWPQGWGRGKRLASAVSRPGGPSGGLRYAPAASSPAGAGVFAFARTLVRVCSHTVRLCSQRNKRKDGRRRK